MDRRVNTLTNRIANPLRSLSVCSLSLATFGLSLAALSPAGAQKPTQQPPPGKEAAGMERMLLPSAVIPPLKEIKHPHAGRANIKIDPRSDTITLPDGKKISLSQARRQFAQQESQLNRQGGSLFDPDAFSIELAPDLDYGKLEEQRQALLKQPAGSTGMTGNGYTPNTITPFGATYFSQTYPWSWSAGDPSFFQVSLNANLTVNAASDNLLASAEGRADGAVLSQNFNIARAYASAGSSQGRLNANLSFQVLGYYLLNWSAQQSVSWTYNFSWQREVATPYTIWLGPIPVSGRVGIRGGIGCNLGLGLYGASVAGKATPNVSMSGFAEAGVNLWLAGAGVGGSLNFLNCGFPNEARVYLQFDSSNRPQLVTNVKSHLDLNTLSGNFYIWAQLFGNYRYWTLWNWPGVQWSGDIFNDTHVINLF